MSQILEKIIHEMPAGLDRAILDVVKFHCGYSKAISRKMLMKNLAMMGFPMRDDRPVRICIHQLRKKGILICSTGGEGGGYWLGATRKEVYEFTNSEYKPRAMDMLETAKMMENAADQQFGEGTQKSFI